MPRIPLIEDLTRGPVPPASNILVEFEAESQWYNASLTMAIGWLKQGGTMLYHTYSQPPDNIRLKLKRMGLDAEDLEKNEKLQICDWYTCQLGQKSKEKIAVESLKTADLRILFSRTLHPYMRLPRAGVLQISDNTSAVARFNDEKAWVEYVLTRVVPFATLNRSISIRGLMKGVHSDWGYKQLEGAHDGIVDFTVEEVGGEWRNLMAIRNMRDVGYDSRSHPLKMDDNLHVTLEK